MKKFIAALDCIWRPSKAVREALKEEGLYVYDMRSWDEGLGNTLEPRVVINYEGSVVTNFAITDWDIDDEHGKVINDMSDWIEKNDVEQRDYDVELEKIVKDIIDCVKEDFNE